jgi:hypothetical protein
METIALALELMQRGLPLAQEIIDAVNQEMGLSGSGVPITGEQQATIDAGLQSAHDALQAAQQAP